MYLVLSSKSVSSCDLTELDEIHDIDGGYVVLPPCQVVPPVTLLPEAETLESNNKY